MVKKIQEILPAIRALCQKHKIEKLWLFGSALDEHSFLESSDVDFLYQLLPISSGREYLDNLYNFRQGLKTLLQREVDILEYKKFQNPYFREEVENTKVLIFEYGKKYEEISV